MKKLKFGLYLLLAFCLLGMGYPPSPAEAGVSPQPLFAPQIGPVLTIPSLIVAPPNDTVTVPVQFTGNGNNIASVAFSIDYNNTWLSFDPTLPFSITFNVPAAFLGNCDLDLTDTDGEIDCYVVDPVIPISILPDGVIASIRFRTLNGPEGTVAPVNFSGDPLVTFGDDNAENIPGSALGGSVLFKNPPVPPTLITPLVASGCTIDLYWSDNSYNEDGFIIERRSGILPFDVVEVAPPDSNHYTDAGLQTNTTYTYRICAYNAAGTTCSGEASATTQANCSIHVPLVWSNYSTNLSISGVVRDGAAIPIAGADVCAGALCTTSGIDGSYTLGSLTPGDYFLGATITGFTCSLDFTNPVNIPPSATGKNFTCTSTANNSISGTVTNNYGFSLPGVLVVDPYTGLSGLSDSLGNYTIGGLPVGSYYPEAYLTGYNCSPLFAYPVTVPPSATSKNFECELSACQNIIQNGDFEARAAWQMPATEYTAGYSTALSHSGWSSMRTGIVNPYHNRYSYSSARQRVTIPSNAYSAILRFFRYPISGDLYMGKGASAIPSGIPNFGEAFELAPLAPSSGDVQMALILDTGDNILSTLMWSLSNAQKWQYREYDLAAFRGYTIKVYFGTYNDGWGGVTSLFVDDVELEVCQH